MQLYDSTLSRRPAPCVSLSEWDLGLVCFSRPVWPVVVWCVDGWNAQAIECLCVFIECSGPHGPSTAQMAEELLTFAWPFRGSTFPEVYDLRSDSKPSPLLILLRS